MEAPKLGQKIDAALVHATATGRVPLDEMSGSLGDGKELSAKVGRYIARAGPMKHTAFATLKPGALSTSHPGLALPAEYAKRTCSTSDWAEYDGTLSQAAEICASTVNFEGLTQRSHVPLAKQWVHGLDQELLQTISDLTYVYRILDDYSGPILPLHRWSMLRRPEGGAVGSYEEGPREGLRALSQRYARALWNEDLTSLRKTPLISEVPLYENSLASDGQWRILMVLGSRHGRLHNGHPNLLDEEGDAYMPELQGDLGTYNTVNGCVERQENAVLRGGFASEEAAAENVKALRMVWAFNQLKPQATTAAHRCAAAPPLSHVPAVSDGSRARVLSLQMHNQMALVKANIMPRYKMGSLETERVQQGFSVFKPSREGQHFRAKKELSLRRLLAYCGCLLRRFHIYECEKWVNKCKLAADGKVSCCSLTSPHIFLRHPSLSRHLRCTITLGALPCLQFLDRADFLRLWRKMVQESNADEEMAGMNKEVFDDTLPLRLEIRLTRAGLMEISGLVNRCAPPRFEHARDG
jgi:hypothetical protein